jgi:hypothetical protein
MLQSSRLRKVFAGGVAVAAVVALAGSAAQSSDQAQNAPSPTAGSSNNSSEGSSGGSSSPAAQAYAVGETATAGDWSVVVNSVKDPWTSPEQFDQPDGRYVAVDVTVTNNGDNFETVSSLLCFELSDSSGRNITESIVVGGEPSVGGSVEPGGKTRGMLYYDAPADATGLTLKFSCDLLSSDFVKINL